MDHIFDLTYLTCKFALHIQLLKWYFNPLVIHLWTSWALRTQPSPANITIERLPTVVGSGNLLLSRQYSWYFLSNMADHQPTSSSAQPTAAAAPAASLSEVKIIDLMLEKYLT